MSMDDFSKIVEELVDQEEFALLRIELARRPTETRAADLWTAALGILQSGYPDEAADYAHELHRITPEDPGALGLVAYLAHLKGDLAGAEMMLRSALVRYATHDINRSGCVTQLAEVLFAMDRFEECESLCLSDWTDLVLNPLTPTIVTRAMLLARLMVRLERWSEAAAYYTTALRACRRRQWGIFYIQEALSALSAILSRIEEPSTRDRTA